MPEQPPLSPKAAGLRPLPGERKPVTTNKDADHIAFTDSHGDRCVVTGRPHWEGEERNVQIRCVTPSVQGDWVILSETQARELFNWLGVHLHRL